MATNLCAKRSLEQISYLTQWIRLAISDGDLLIIMPDTTITLTGFVTHSVNRMECKGILAIRGYNTRIVFPKTYQTMHDPNDIKLFTILRKNFLFSNITYYCSRNTLIDFINKIIEISGISM
jgi:hypothetical protein